MIKDYYKNQRIQKIKESNEYIDNMLNSKEVPEELKRSIIKWKL